jgi:uncharacterized protein (DUF58 family)
MISKELAKKIRQIQIYTAKAVNAAFAGQYESTFKGRGMQFDEVREYTPGDDIRSIDWNVTARSGKTHIKRFVEEREMTVLFAVDLSGSGDFGTVNKTKNELAAEFCAVLAFAALRNNDKVGLVIFTDQIELYIPPKKGSSHVLRLIREVLYFKSKSSKTSIAGALDYIAGVTKKRATIFLLSDFLDEGFAKTAGILNRRHDLIAVPVVDRAENDMASAGIVELVDAETGKLALVDTNSKRFKKQYRRLGDKRKLELKSTLRSAGIDAIEISTDSDYVHDLAMFFRMRQRRY